MIFWFWEPPSFYAFLHRNAGGPVHVNRDLSAQHYRNVQQAYRTCCTLVDFQEAFCPVPQPHALALGHSNWLIVILFHWTPWKGILQQCFCISSVIEPPVSSPLTNSSLIVPRMLPYIRSLEPCDNVLLLQG
jgi:hypothetical protein